MNPHRNSASRGNANRLLLTAVGDIMAYGQLAKRMSATRDRLWALRPVLKELAKGDVLFGNFECPVTRDARPGPNRPSQFGAPPGAASAMGQAGFDIVNLAQNHICDFGEEGVQATLDELQQAGVQSIGIGRTFAEARTPRFLTTASGLRVGFLAYTTCFNAIDESLPFTAAAPDLNVVRADVAALQCEADLVVVSCHTGDQDSPYPSPETRELAHATIDAGATVFLGHHPHVAQGVERYGRGVIAYSLGDFMAPPRTEHTRRTFILHVVVEGKQVMGFKQAPCYITDDCRTVLAENEIAESLQQRLINLNRQVESGQSDRLYYDHRRKSFLSSYVPGIWRELRACGPRIIFRKVRHLRKQHLRMLLNAATLGLYRPGVVNRREQEKWK